MTITSGKQEHPPKYGLRSRVRRRTAMVVRWLHIYLSMLSFAVIFFFAVTGFTLNHADWFASSEQTSRYGGTVPASLLHESGGAQPDKLGIVELLRNRHRIHGAMSEFRVDDGQISVSFKGPGYAADVSIDGSTGQYDVTESQDGVVAILNDLHKGRDTGKVWPVVIDVSAVLLTLVSLTGLFLIWFVYKRRVSGLILAGIAGIVCWLLYHRFVP